MPNQKRKNYGKRRRRYQKKQMVMVRGKVDNEITNTGKTNMKPLLYRGIGIPPAFYTKIKFNYDQLNNTSTLSDLVVRGNGAYDPLFAVGGLQPMYYDQLTALYERYCVLASEITATFVNQSNVGTGSFQKVGIYALTDSSGPANLSEATERDNCKYAHLGPANGDQGIITINHYAKTTDVVGKANSESQDDILSALNIAVPSRQWFWHVFAGTLDGSTNQSVHVDITVTYYIKFYDRFEVAQS